MGGARVAHNAHDWMMPANPYRFDTYQGRRVLVTGASGFIGRWVARALNAAGAELWLAARDKNALASVCEAYEIRGQWRAADLADRGTFARLYGEVQPDVVFNLAGYGVDPAERDETLITALNVRLVREIAETVASGGNSDWQGIRLIHVGTAAEYGAVGGPLTEYTAAAPVSLYGRSKLEGTRALEVVRERSGLRAITARLFTVYGPGEHAGRLLPSMIAAARSGATLSLTGGEQRRDFTYVGDVADGLLRLGALIAPAPAVVNLVTGKLTSVRAFVECAAALLGLGTWQLRFGALAYRQDEVQQGPVDIRLLRQLLDWVPACSVREGIQQTINFEGRLSGVRS